MSKKKPERDWLEKAESIAVILSAIANIGFMIYSILKG